MPKEEEAGCSSLIQHISHTVAVTGFHLCQAAFQSTRMTTQTTKSHVCSIDQDTDLKGPPVMYSPATAQGPLAELRLRGKKERKELCRQSANGFQIATAVKMGFYLHTYGRENLKLAEYSRDASRGTWGRENK